jgi:hypothetical protein
MAKQGRWTIFKDGRTSYKLLADYQQGRVDYQQGHMNYCNTKDTDFEGTCLSIPSSMYTTKPFKHRNDKQKVSSTRIFPKIAFPFQVL